MTYEYIIDIIRDVQTSIDILSDGVEYEGLNVELENSSDDLLASLANISGICSQILQDLPKTEEYQHEAETR